MELLPRRVLRRDGRKEEPRGQDCQDWTCHRFLLSLWPGRITTRANADEPLAIVARKGSGIRPGAVEDLRGKRIGLAKEQTSDEYLKMVQADSKLRDFANSTR